MGRSKTQDSIRIKPAQLAIEWSWIVLDELRNAYDMMRLGMRQHTHVKPRGQENYRTGSGIMLQIYPTTIELNSHVHRFGFIPTFRKWFRKNHQEIEPLLTRGLLPETRSEPLPVFA